MQGSTQITLKREAVHSNIRFLRKKFGQKVTISAVVKANAYGHGIEHMVPLLEEADIHHFSVFDYDEAIRVKQSLHGEAEIMIMGWIGDKDLQGAIKAGFDFYIFNIQRIHHSLRIARKLKKPAFIHLEVESGMNRTGLHRDELAEALEIISVNPECFEVKGICTHLAGPESVSNHVRILRQLKKFQKDLGLLLARGIQPKYRHVANSAASIVYPQARMDLVRVGIMLYGFWSSSETFIHYVSKKIDKSDPLQRVLDWRSHIMSINKIDAGSFVGYGISYLAQVPIMVAIVPVGYSSGYNRSLSNKGRVLIRGVRCGVIGLVNMSMIIVDVSNVEDVRVGDEVVIIGKQEDLEIKVSAFSDISNQLNYEVLTQLPKGIERKII